MKIEFNLELTNPTKTIILHNCMVDSKQGNHKLYCIKNLLDILTKNFIGVDKQDINLINNLKSNKITHITI